MLEAKEMKPIAIISLILLIGITAALAADTVNAVVAQMTNEAASWEERCAAEDSLTKMPPQEVLPVLLPHIQKGMPSLAGIWNSAGREFDRHAPIEWQIYYAVSRSWDHQVDTLPRDGGGVLLLELLNKTPAAAANARRKLLTDLTHRWVPSAESTVAGVFKNPDEKLDVRTTAALALILHGTEGYHELLLVYAAASNHADRKRWYDLLSDPRHKKQTGIDPRVVQMGFNLILTEQESSPNYVHGAYFLVIRTGDYIDVEFKPDQKRPEYQGKHGLTESFFQDTVKNAIAWLTVNKTRIEKELLTTRIR